MSITHETPARMLKRSKNNPDIGGRIVFDITLLLGVFYIVFVGVLAESLPGLAVAVVMVFLGIAYLPKFLVDREVRDILLVEAVETGNIRGFLRITFGRIAIIAVSGPALWVWSPNWCTPGNTYLGVTCWEARAVFSATISWNLLLALFASGVAANASYKLIKAARERIVR